MDITVWDIVQGAGSILALTSIELAGRNNFTARMWAWCLVIAGHATIITAGIILGLEGLYILNVGMMLAGLRNIYRDLKIAREERHFSRLLRCRSEKSDHELPGMWENADSQGFGWTDTTGIRHGDEIKPSSLDEPDVR